MKLIDIPKVRLYNQHIAHQLFSDPGDVVRWLGAVQAQDYMGAVWAIGLRLKNSNESAIEKAIEDRKIVRSWPMRGTLHFVTAEDLRWMLQYFSPRVIQRSARLYQEAEIDKKVLARSGKLLNAELKNMRQMTRNEIYATWERAKISTSGQRGLHILGHHALSGLICFGPKRGKQQTFVLLEEWLPPSKTLQREEAVAALALAYFRSHGPATVHDFSWWSGLTIAEAKKAVDSVSGQMESKTLEDQEYLMLSTSNRQTSSQQVFLLPNYDEYFVAYKDRSASLNPKIIKDIKRLGNGIFTAPVVVNGLMSGYWKRSFAKDKVLIQTNVLSSVKALASNGIDAAARKFGKFLNLPVEVSQGSV